MASLKDLAERVRNAFSSAVPAAQNAANFVPQFMANPAGAIGRAANNYIQPQQVTQARQFMERVTPPINTAIQQGIGRMPSATFTSVIPGFSGDQSQRLIRNALPMIADTPTSYLRGYEYLKSPQRRQEVSQMDALGKLQAGGDLLNFVPMGTLAKQLPKGVGAIDAVQSTLGQAGKIKLGSAKPAISLVDDELKGLMGQLEKQLASYNGKKQVVNQTRELFSKDAISIFNRIKQMAKSRKVQAGDIETLRSKNPKLVQSAFEAVMEQNPSIQDDQGALDFILNFPAKNGIKMSPETSVLKTKISGLKNISESGVFPGNDSVSVVPTQKTLNKINIKNDKAVAKTLKDDFDQWQKAVFAQEGAQSTGKAVKQAINAIKTNTKTPISNPDDINDISGFYTHNRDLYRNFKAAYGKNFAQVKSQILDPFDQAKGRVFKNLEQITSDLDKNIVQGLGIKKGSSESAAVQEFGEGLRDYSSLIKQFGEEKANKIVRADQWFRQNYDRLLGEVNQVRAGIYPNNPEKQIPKRNDYYRHFREMSQGIQGLLNIFETPAGVSSKLAGVSYQTKPKSKFLSFAQKRLGMQTDVDAVGGFLDYVKAAEYAKNIDPQIERFRALSTELADATTEGPNAGKLNNFILYLNRFADDLAGKTNPWDRLVQETIPGGRKTLSVINWMNSRVKANTIIGNLSSTIAQAFNIPQGIASAGPANASRGIGRSLAGMFNPNNPMKDSTFLNERYFRAFDKFDRGMLANTKKMAVWITQVLDEVGTKYIWNSHYEKALAEGIPNPIKYADDITRNLVAGRGIGEVPILQKSRTFQLVAPFTLEVGNLWHVMGDMVGEKKFGQLATLFVMNYLFNRGAEQVRGSAVTFDPIQATIEALGELQEGKPLQAGGRLAGEVLTNVPLGSTVAALYPEYGGTIGDTQLPTRKELFGRADPTRFGTGLVAAQGITDPLFKLVPPYGGNQLKKTIEGLSTFNQGYSATDKGMVRFPIDQNPVNAIKSAAFGQYSTPEARAYFMNEQKPLGEAQSQLFKGMQGSDRQGLYNSIVSDRELNAEADSIKSSLEAGNLPATSVQQATFNLDGLDRQGYLAGNKFIYYDEDSGEVKSLSMQSLQKKQLAQEKELVDAKYSFYADELKRGDDYQGYTANLENYINYLEEYKTKVTGEADKIKIQNTINDKKAELAKYKGYGGFSKPKKPKKVKITIKRSRSSAPTVTIRKTAVGKIPVLKLKKSPTIRVKADFGTVKAIKVAPFRNVLSG